MSVSLYIIKSLTEDFPPEIWPKVFIGNYWILSWFGMLSNSNELHHSELDIMFQVLKCGSNICKESGTFWPLPALPHCAMVKLHSAAPNRFPCLQQKWVLSWKCFLSYSIIPGRRTWNLKKLVDCSCSVMSFTVPANLHKKECTASCPTAVGELSRDFNKQGKQMEARSSCKVKRIVCLIDYMLNSSNSCQVTT